jgi:hypothetical protein
VNRRSFLNLTVGGIAAAAAVRTWPFRVYSFPSDIKLLSLPFQVGDWVQFEEDAEVMRLVALSKKPVLLVDDDFAREFPYLATAFRRSR